jgi:probable HAF family extracellular repeat protein
VLLAVPLLAGSLFVASTAAATTSTLEIAPVATSTLAVGDTFSVGVAITSTEALSGAQATVTFDPAVVQLRSYTRGAAWAQAPFQIAGTTIASSNQTGALKAVASAFFPPDAVPAGHTDFLSLTFQAVACGSTWLGLPTGGPTNATLLGGTNADYGLSIPLSTAGGTATVCPGSTPAPSPTPTPTPTSRPTPGATAAPPPTPSPTGTPSPTPSPTSTPPPAAKGWTVRDIGTLGGGPSSAAAVNAEGQVAGTAARRTGGTHAFLWRKGRMTDLGDLGGGYSAAVAINDRGDVLGMSQTANGEMHAFLWAKGRMTDLGSSVVYAGSGGLNSRGTAVGTTWRATSQAVVWIHGVAGALPTLGGGCVAIAINDHDVIVGQCSAGGEPHAVIWTRRH